MTASAERLLAAIGKSAADPEVSAILRDLDLSGHAPKIMDGVSSDIEAPKHGVALFFRTAHHLRSVDPLKGLPPDSPVVSDVAFSWKGFGGGPGFSGKLPYDLDFTETREAVRVRLGPPAWSSPIVANDKWTFGDRYLTVVFFSKRPGIGQVTCGLNWVP
jgi:hypothetical protein